MDLSKSSNEQLANIGKIYIDELHKRVEAIGDSDLKLELIGHLNDAHDALNSMRTSAVNGGIVHPDSGGGNKGDPNSDQVEPGIAPALDTGGVQPDDEGPPNGG